MAGDKEAPWQEHLVELLERLKKILIALTISTALSFVIPVQILTGEPGYTPIAFYLMRKIRDDMINLNNPLVKPVAKVLGIKKLEVMLIAVGWVDSIEVLLEIGILFGLVVSAPYIGYHVYKYLEPALLEHEKKYLTLFTLLFLTLFLAGVLYAYYIILPITMVVLTWLFMLGGVSLTFSVKEFFSFVIFGMLTIGLSFTFPLVVAFAAYLDLITPETLKKSWRYVTFVIFAVTAIVTPDPTPVSMFLLAAPFLVLYTLAYLLAKKMHRIR